MKFTPLEIPDIILIEPDVHQDERGYFFESFRKDLFEKNIGKINFVQENESKSSYGVLRGLHYQIPPYEQSKLVRVITGEILDVSVDIRQGSNYFGKYISCKLNSNEKKQLFIPAGFAHGFIVLSSEAIINYKVDNYYSSKHDAGIIYNDETLQIDWILDQKVIKLSDKDRKLSTLNILDINNS